MTAYHQLYAMLDHLQRANQWQLEKINKLEQEMDVLKQQIQKLQSEPRNHIDKIEYHFDQLKVENLNGKLSIGVNPQDAGAIDEMWVAGKYSEGVKPPQDVAAPQMTENETESLHEEVRKYIDEDITASLLKKAGDRNVTLTSENIKAIVEDMVRQSNTRIKDYVTHFLSVENKPNEDARASAMSKVKQDLYDAMENYLDYFLKNAE